MSEQLLSDHEAAIKEDTARTEAILDENARVYGEEKAAIDEANDYGDMLVLIDEPSDDLSERAYVAYEEKDQAVKKSNEFATQNNLDVVREAALREAESQARDT